MDQAEQVWPCRIAAQVQFGMVAVQGGGAYLLPVQPVYFNRGGIQRGVQRHDKPVSSGIGLQLKVNPIEQGIHLGRLLPTRGIRLRSARFRDG